MILTLGFLIACVAFAWGGTKFVVWCVKRSLPVPQGPFLMLRFLFWWWLSVFVAASLYMLVLVALIVFAPGYIKPGVVLENSVLTVGGLVVTIPYWVGLFKGCDLQLNQRWSGRRAEAKFQEGKG